MDRFFDKPGSSENPPRPIVKNKGYWYLATKSHDWDEIHKHLGFNPGDCCWWTGLGVMAWKDPLMASGLLQLTPIKGGVWRRHPFNETGDDPAHAVDHFSRDQLINAIAALATTDLPSAKQAIRLTKFKLSKKFHVGIPTWLWLKSIQFGDNIHGKLMAKLFALSLGPVITISAAYNAMIRSILGPKAKQVHPNDKVTPAVKFDHKHLQWINDNLRLKAYPMELWGNQVYTIRKLGISKLPMLSSVIRLYAGKFNYMISLLTGKKINKSVIKDYVPRHGWLWNTWIDSATGDFVKRCTAREAKYNALDKDLLWVLYDELKK